MRRTYIHIIFLLLPLFPLIGSRTQAQAQSYEDLILKSYEFLDKNDLPAAEAAIREAMRVEPANPANYALLFNLGTVQRRQGKHEDAISSYTIALARDPRNVMILGNRASLYMETGDADNALSDYNLILMIDTLNEDALYNRGLIFIHKKSFLWAEQDFDRLLQINGLTFYGRMGHAILEKARGNHEESERIYSYLIDKMPHEPQLYRGRADLYFLMGKNARAMADINRVFNETTPTAGDYITRGKIRLAQYEREMAIRDFTTARDLGYNADIVEDLLRLARPH